MQRPHGRGDRVAIRQAGAVSADDHVVEHGQAGEAAHHLERAADPHAADLESLATEHLSADSTPFSTLNNVVLPAPLGPMMPRISPSASEKLTSLTAFRPPNARDSPSIWRSGATEWADARRFKGGSGTGSTSGPRSGIGCGVSRRNQRSRMVQNNPSGDSSMMAMMA